MSFPLLVSVTRLRRQTTDVVRQVAQSGRPVFVTQYGSVAMVLLTRRAYERLLRAAATPAAPTTNAAADTHPAPTTNAGADTHAAPKARASAEAYDAPMAGAATEGNAVPVDGYAVPADVALDPLSVFGRLPEGTLFETRWGLVHADTAAFFMEEGETVKPFLSPERLHQAALDALDES